MKCMLAVILACALLTGGCAAPRETAVTAEQMELVSTTPLPPITYEAYATGMKLNVLMHVLDDGSVETVRMLGTSGDPAWDSLAVTTMKQWRYAPFQKAGGPKDIWFRQLVVVQIHEPVVMTIGEIALASAAAADSVYALLGKGTDLDQQFRQTMATSDITKYPKAVRDRLGKLNPGDYTGPIRLGDRYLIYKRFPE